jgi:hypothetical protein
MARSGLIFLRVVSVLPLEGLNRISCQISVIALKLLLSLSHLGSGKWPCLQNTGTTIALITLLPFGCETQQPGRGRPERSCLHERMSSKRHLFKPVSSQPVWEADSDSGGLRVSFSSACLWRLKSLPSLQRRSMRLIFRFLTRPHDRRCNIEAGEIEIGQFK